VLSQIEAGQAAEVLGFIAEDPDAHGKTLSGHPVLGDWSWFDGVDRADIEVVCASGTPAVLRTLVAKANSRGLRFGRAISPSAIASPFAKLGVGVVLFPGTVVSTDASIGDHTTLNVAASVSHDAMVGPCCNINPGVRLAGNVSVGQSCYIGMGTQVIQGISIGEGSIIGAGAVVIQDIPANVTAVGVPAKIIERREPVRVDLE
jgi:sugar O-acyltransferase (sialic acid O-acetyltransferase NeuD family)